MKALPPRHLGEIEGERKRNNARRRQVQDTLASQLAGLALVTALLCAGGFILKVF